MNPFLEIPIVIGKKKLLRRYERKTVARILPGEIALHYPDDYGCTVIVMKSGASITTPLTAINIDEARQVYDRTIKQHPGRANNLQIVHPT